MKTAFISYSHEDADFAEDLALRLSRAGIGVWLDRWEIRVGDRITAKINAAIRNNDYVLALLSVHSITSRWVQEEVGAALQKGSDVILPMILPSLKDDDDIPPLLRDRLYADFRHDSEEALGKLLEVLRPGIDVLRSVLDPLNSGRVVVLTGTSTRLYQRGAHWSKAPSGAVGAQFAFEKAIKAVFHPSRDVLWNFADAMPLHGLRNGDNVITIGSPKVNRFAAGFLEQCEREKLGSVWFVGRKEWRQYGQYLALKGTKSTYRPTIDRIRGHGTGKDFGLVVWAPSLAPHGGTTLITGGCHTPATHAAAEVAASLDFYSDLMKQREIRQSVRNRLRGFWAIIEVGCKDFAAKLYTISVRESGVLLINDRLRPEDFRTGACKYSDSPPFGSYDTRRQSRATSTIDRSWTPSREALREEFPGVDDYNVALQMWWLMEKGEAP